VKLKRKITFIKGKNIKKMRIKLIKIIHHKFRLNDKIKNKLDFYKMIKKNKIKNKKISIKLKKKKTSKDGSMKLVTATLINLQVLLFYYKLTECPSSSHVKTESSFN
jgi:hypothetical protein